MPEHRFEFAKIMTDKGFLTPEAYVMDGLLDIVDEGVLGASNHVSLSLSLIAKVAAQGGKNSCVEALMLANFIALVRGEGAPIVANAVNWQVEGLEGLSDENAVQRLQDRALDWEVSARDRRDKLLAKANEMLTSIRRPMIYDYSSTVADLIRTLAINTGLEAIIIPESRAIDGGRRYMNALADLNVNIDFLPDSAIEYAATYADAVFLGAESVTLDGGIINTIGSTSTARAAQAHNVPVYGAADLFKVGTKRANEMPSRPLREFPFLLKANEAARTSAPELEIVPPALISAILTEVGPVVPMELESSLHWRNV
ncbi:hypothetical protein [Pacificibacter sp. AS14]|uniref:hypothetical protein n=1 Tax=Pacificibacter sp. AS14 TaxID=3135785 RepID=UPI003173755A